MSPKSRFLSKTNATNKAAHNMQRENINNFWKVSKMRKKISIVLFLTLGLAATVAKADYTFGEPTNLGPTVNSSAMDFDSSISPDGLSLYFGSERSGGSGGKDLWVTMRETVSGPWG